MSRPTRSGRPTARSAATGVLSGCLGAVEAAAFWLAIALPLVYGPVLVAGAVGGDLEPAFYLVGFHAVAVAVGQGHDAG